MSNYDNSNSGILGRNKRRRDGSKDPEFSGQCEVGGVEYWINAWVRESRKPEGGKFFSLSFKPKDQQTKPKAPAAADTPPDEDDSVPF